MLLLCAVLAKIAQIIESITYAESEAYGRTNPSSSAIFSLHHESSVTETRKHVLIWVKQEFLQSPGMLQLLKETGIFSHPRRNGANSREAAEVNRRLRAQRKAGGLAIIRPACGFLHPVASGLEVLVPWHFVISLVTAEEPQSSKAFGLIIDEAERNALKKTP